MSDPRIEQRRYIQRVMAHTGLSGTALAKKAGLAQTTITRFMNEEEHSFALSARSMAAIGAASGLPLAGPAMHEAREPEALPFSSDAAVTPDVKSIVENYLGGVNDIAPFTLRSRALDALGYLPGDIMIVDMAATPDVGDIVCAQNYEWEIGQAETVFRSYEPPYLLASSTSKEMLLPLVIDNRKIVLKGVVVASIRPLRVRRAA